ncbi:glycoprotein C [Cercopithecine alphaherpesvirus 9]|uniref:Glycoprotein C n=1 Tax=Cercopithecine herpesvirus 9 (strain DHV) TaxID=36348 RepID=Q9E201_CHV9D|nr:envelope glycoprotein C [Cercopithecine alphaherpesvirus 9]AAG27187.1 glycoprotein C [Cercopithecine alphaherpesvirus 9]
MPPFITIVLITLTYVNSIIANLNTNIPTPQLHQLSDPAPQSHQQSSTAPDPAPQLHQAPTPQAYEQFDPAPQSHQQSSTAPDPAPQLHQAPTPQAHEPFTSAPQAHEASVDTGVSTFSKTSTPAFHTQTTPQSTAYTRSMEHIACTVIGRRFLPYFHKVSLPCYLQIFTGYGAYVKRHELPTVYREDFQHPNRAWKPLLRPDLHVEIWFKKYDSKTSDLNFNVQNSNSPLILLYSNIINTTSMNPDLSNTEKYILPDRNTTYDFTLHIVSLDVSTEGTYIWRVIHTANNTVINEQHVTVMSYKRPNVTVISDSVLLGNPYTAYCKVNNYYPPNSVIVKWTSNLGNVRNNFITYSKKYNTDGLVSSVSTLHVPATLNADYPPSLRCNVLWIRDSVSHTKYSSAVTPDVYYKPNVSIEVIDGRIVCLASCVPRGVVRINWWINDIPVENTNTEILSVCNNNRRFVNLRSYHDVSGTDGPMVYSCKLVGYPKKFPPFVAVYTYDASSSASTFPLISAIIGIVTIIVILLTIVLLCVLCRYCCK